MLQQTQAERVIPKYKSFLKKFPTVAVLAKASLSSVLKEWQGLGYNRRAKMLHAAAKEIISGHGGRFPNSYDDLVKLPGVGPYTASAVRVFAFNKPEVLIETNIRSVCIHHFFPKRKKVMDASLMPFIEAAVDRKNPKAWYSALMDYGSFLKRTEGNASKRSARHVRQKPFKGSNREVRGAILKMLAEKTRKKKGLFTLPFRHSVIEVQYQRLLSEGLISFSGGRVRLG